MVSKLRFVLTAGIIALSLVSSPATAQDPYNLGISVTKMCDLRPDGDSRMSDKCYGFISAVVEIMEVNQGMPKERMFSRPACIPDGLKVEDIYKAIRPALMDVGPCLGLCTSTSYVISALIRVYPCRQ